MPFGVNKALGKSEHQISKEFWEEGSHDEVTYLISERNDSLDGDDDLESVFDTYAQSRKWNVAVAVLAFALIIVELFLICYCGYRLVVQAKRPDVELAYVKPVAWSIIGSGIWTIIIAMLGLLSWTPKLKRRTYVILNWIYFVSLLMTMIAQMVAASLPFFIFDKQTYGAAAIIFVAMLFGLNLVIAIIRLMIIIKEDQNVTKTHSEFVSSSF